MELGTEDVACRQSERAWLGELSPEDVAAREQVNEQSWRENRSKIHPQLTHHHHRPRLVADLFRAG